jgi:hypothetical protein
MALMVVLESLSPAERTSFVLHDVFGMEFDGVAEVVGRTPAACRQLAARARRHVRERTPRFDARPGEQRRVLDAFLGAAMSGDLVRCSRSWTRTSCSAPTAAVSSVLPAGRSRARTTWAGSCTG